MRSDPPGPSGLLPRRKRKVRVTLLWAAFAVATVAIAFAVHRLYETVRRELQEQSEVALREQQAKFSERVREVTDAARHAAMKTLVSFHTEGLGSALRRWQESDATIRGTFQWQGEQGLLPGATFPGEAMKAEALAELWERFRAWRAQQPKATAYEPTVVGAYRSAAVRTIDNPRFAAGELGYQGENLEMLSYAERPVDPWVGWAGHRTDPTAPWIMWYQAGPGAPVRGCFVSFAPILAQLRSELADRRLARLELVAERDSANVADDRTRISLAAWLPGFALAADQGELFTGKQSEARLAALAIVLLLALLMIGAAFLAVFSRREMRDAEHKTTFVTQVSHELRTPLTSIRMFADMLAAPDLPEAKRAKFAGTISRESERLGALIERLLTFNALKRGGSPSVVTSVDVGSVVRETLEEMEATLGSAGMRVEAPLPAEPVVALTDRSAIKQALLNLLENALKYARGGGLIRITLTRATDGVRLQVADEGPGIPRELRSRVFEPFVQGGRSLTDKSPGVGLGLSIARGLLRQAGGDLVLLPSEKGAVFELRLPFAAS